MIKSCLRSLWMPPRCMMNAFLAAQTFVLPINNYDEMLKSNFKLIMARGTTYEDLYKYAQEVITAQKSGDKLNAILVIQFYFYREVH